MKTVTTPRRSQSRNRKHGQHQTLPVNGNGQAKIVTSPAVSANVSAWLAAPKANLIGGKWVPAVSGKTFEVFNPADGTEIARVSDSDWKDIDLAVASARKTFEAGPWRQMTPSERGKLLWRIGDLILQHADEFAEIESIDNGKPRAVARVADVPLAADLFQYMAGWATKVEGNTIPISVPLRAGVPLSRFHVA
jgi:phenylacetaldehyde dehydrogenase